MHNIESLYAMQSLLNNLLMFKRLHHFGIDLKQFDSSVLTNYNEYSGLSFNEAFDCFSTVTSKLFDIFEVYSDYDDTDCDADKMYWFKEAKYDGALCKSHIVVVIMDETLQNVQDGAFGYSHNSGEMGMSYKIDRGLVIIHDTDYGDIDWCDFIVPLLTSRQKALIQEEKQYEMAI